MGRSRGQASKFTLALIAVFFTTGALTYAEDFQIRNVRPDVSDKARIEIEYLSASNASFTLLRGDSVTNTAYPNQHQPTEIDSSHDWMAIAAGERHILLLKTNGTLWSWGLNRSGQLGDGTTIDHTEPMQIGSEHNWSTIRAGDAYSMALKTDGTVWIWGSNGCGQLGPLNLIETSPVQVKTPSP